MCCRETPGNDWSVQPAATSFVRAAASSGAPPPPPTKPSRAPTAAAPRRTPTTATTTTTHGFWPPAVLVGAAPRCLGAFTLGFLSAMPRANVAAGLVQALLGKRRRPPTGLAFVDPMVIVALLAGLAVGALSVLVAVRPALLERRRRVEDVIELERALAGVEAELAVERGSLDERLEAAVKVLSTEAL